MKRTKQATEGLSWGSGEGAECVGGRERQHQEPASREGRAARKVEAQEQSGSWGRTEAEGSPARRLRPDRWKGLETRGTGRARPRSGSGGRRQGRDQS